MKVEEPMSKGEFVLLTFYYTGEFGDDIFGLYQSHYTDDDGTEHHIVATFIEPAYAIQVMTSYDLKLQ